MKKFWFKEELLMILQDTLLNSMVSQKNISKCLIKQSGEYQGYIPYMLFKFMSRLHKLDLLVLIKNK